MKFINLTTAPVQIKTMSGKLISIEPYPYDIRFEVKPIFRRATSYPNKYALEVDADKIAIERKDAVIAINNLPQPQKGIAYIVDYPIQNLIRTFTKRSDFFTVIDNQLCDLRPKRRKESKI